VYVCNDREPCKNGWTDRYADLVVNSGCPKQLCTRWGPDPPREGHCWGDVGISPHAAEHHPQWPWPQMQLCRMKFSQWKSPCEAAMRPFVKLFWQLVFVNVVWKAITRNDIHCPLLKRSRFKKWNHARVLGLPSQCQWLSTLGRFCKQDYGNIGLINCRLWSFQLRRVPYSYHICSVYF